ncbi:ribosomal protein L7/L12 [Streptomyces sp. NPDC048337]|uniref:ribosomal protein L7/L12 n=1 Tax=Streptomyces sp. NPDC048337 TaxID=3365535 RepID=UPI00371B856A
MLLTDVGDRRLDLVRAVRAVTGLSLWNSRVLLDQLPAAVMEPEWFEVAQEVAGRLEDAGARVTVRCDWCDRTIARGADPVDPGPCQGPWPEGTCRASRRR